MKLQGGLDVDAVKFTDGMRAVVIELLPYVRLAVKLPDNTERGVRFNDTAGVLWRLESMFGEDEFAHNPVGVIEAALIDAAKSDYWYSNEKDYEWPESVDEDESEGC